MCATLSMRRFEELVARAVATVPARFREHLERVMVIAEERAPRRVRRELELEPDEDLYGYYEGVPEIERGVEDVAPMPDRIYVYRAPLVEDFGDDEDTLVDEIRKTVLHEIGHHFGLEEPDMDLLEE